MNDRTSGLTLAIGVTVFALTVMLAGCGSDKSTTTTTQQYSTTVPAPPPPTTTTTTTSTQETHP